MTVPANKEKPRLLDVDALIERASWLKAAATYLRQMSEVEYAMLNEDSPESIIATLDRAIGLPDPDATLETVERLLDVAADYTNDAAEALEEIEGGRVTVPADKEKR